MNENLLNEPVYAHDDGPDQEPPGSVVAYVHHVYSATPTSAVVELRSTKVPESTTKYETSIPVLIKDGVLGGLNSKWVELDA